MPDNSKASYSALSMSVAALRGLKHYSNHELFSLRYMQALEFICKQAIIEMQNSNAAVSIFTKPFAEQSASMRKSVGLPIDEHSVGRKTLIARKIRDVIKNEGVKQVVCFGGGFDPRLTEEALNHPEIQFYELDKGATFDIKNKVMNDITMIRGFSVPENYHVIECDLMNVNFSEILPPSFDQTKPTLFIAEGVTTYLTPGKVKNIFSEIKKLGKHQFLVSFTAGDFPQGEYESVGMGIADEKLLCHVNKNELIPFCNESGFTVIAQASHMEIHRNMADLSKSTLEKPSKNKKENYFLLTSEASVQENNIKLIPLMEELEALKDLLFTPQIYEENSLGF